EEGGGPLDCDLRRHESAVAAGFRLVLAACDGDAAAQLHGRSELQTCDAALRGNADVRELGGSKLGTTCGRNEHGRERAGVWRVSPADAQVTNFGPATVGGGLAHHGAILGPGADDAGTEACEGGR